MRGKQRRISDFFGPVGVSLQQLTPVISRRGSFGRIELFNHPELGKVFVLNGEVQHVEAWAPLYHEPLVHLAGAFVSSIKDVLILGGGTLYAASEVLKYKSVERVVLLDHDPVVTESTAQYYEHARACLADSRLSLQHKDAYASVAGLRNQFDLVINDGSDLLSIPARQSSRSMVSAIGTVLKPGGVAADVVYRHLFERKRIQRTLSQFRRKFRFALSLIFLPEYHGVLHVLCIWGNRSSQVNQLMHQPRNREQRRWRADPKACPCVYYDPRFLGYYLYLPRYFKSALGSKRTSS